MVGKALSKFLPAGHMPRPVAQNPSIAQSDLSLQSATLKTLADMEMRSQEIQELQARVQKMPQADDQASPGSAASFGWLAGFIASVGLAASVGVAAVRKYSSHGQHGSEPTLGSQISLVPQRTGLVTMKSEIVLADKELEGKIMSVVNATPGNTKSAAMCSQMSAANLDRIRMDEEDGGCNPAGPPFTNATGLGWDTSTEPKNKEDMIDLANKLNPVIGFWDPLGIVTEDTAPETIGWFRHAEIKHGRVAMAGFVGYCVHANGITFPWNIQAPLDYGPGWPFTKELATVSFADISAAGSPGDMWDALPTAGKLQILLVVGFLEMHGESSLALEADGQKHYVRGGKPGYYPKIRGRYPHPVPLDLWDPVGFTKKMSEERKAKALLAEVNNGRLAMIGLFGLICASKGLIVPGLDSLDLARYGGEYMAPFTAGDSILPFVEGMARSIGSYGYAL